MFLFNFAEVPFQFGGSMVKVKALGIYNELHSPHFEPFAHENRTWGMRYVKERKQR